MTRILRAPASFEQEIRKSRFLAQAAPLTHPEDASAFVQARRDPQARHHCWAWRIGEKYRFYDDGEPGGTAGRPILQAIDRYACDRVIVLVIRWFGGIKLGTGGLARAYGGTAARCLYHADLVTWEPTSRVRCRCSYADIDRVQARLSEAGVRFAEQDFDETGVQWQCDVPLARLATIAQLYQDLTHGQGRWVVLTEE